MVRGSLDAHVMEVVNALSSRTLVYRICEETLTRSGGIDVDNSHARVVRIWVKIESSDP